METESEPAPLSLADMEILRALADGGTMDHSRWPSVLTTLLACLNTIALSIFPIPNLPPPRSGPRSILRSAAQPAPPSPSLISPLPSSSPPPPTQSTSSQENKENADPTPALAPAPAPAPASLPPLDPGTLPIQFSSMLDEITRTLSTNFPTKPPHTIQRLAELIVAPRAYYKSLASYLHALDRVVHVTSSVDTYPLPPAVIGAPETNGDVTTGGASDALAPNRGGPVGAAAAAVSWGNPTASVAAVGSDEALGGALLTPIPWLNRAEDAEGELENDDAGSADGASSNSSSATGQRVTIRSESTETIEGPNGMGSVETVSVSVNGVPSTGARAGAGGSHSPSSAGTDTVDTTPAPTAEQESSNEGDEAPHARGPQEVGAEDLGPQPANAIAGAVSMDNLDLEAAVGQRPRPRPSTSPDVEKPTSGAGAGSDAMDTDGADRVGAKREAEGEPEGADAVVKRAKDGSLEPEVPLTLTQDATAEKDDVKMED